MKSKCKNLSLLLTQFWLQHPALFYGISFLFGTALALHHSFFWLFPILCITPWKNFKRLILMICLIISAFLFTNSHTIQPTLSSEGIFGTALIEIDSLCQKSTQFGKKWVYKGRIQSFLPDNSHTMTAKNMAFSLSIPIKPEIQRPVGNQSYQIQGLLKQTKNKNYYLIPKNHQPWYPVKSTWSLSELRYQIKTALSHFIHQNITNSQVASFLVGVSTGDFDDRLMSYEFSRFGLQHIMAISGFHFALISMILMFFFRLFMDRKISAILMVILLTLYFIFLGFNSSIVRAWLMILVAQFSLILEKSSRPLNSLGAALIAILIYNPSLCMSIGFQFSFMVTGTILLLFLPIDQFLEKILPKRSLSLMVKMDRRNQHGYFLLALFRKALALALAVNVVALPLTLFYFQKFPVMSLVYNLFFPFFTSLSIFLLIIACLFHFIFPPLANFLHQINNWFTEHALNFTYNLPPVFDYYIRSSLFFFELMVIYLTLLFLIAIFLNSRQKTENACHF